jgi:hypothetical protein
VQTEKLVTLPQLQSLDLRDNPVADKEHFRLRVVFRLQE